MNHTLSGRGVFVWLLGFFGVIIAVNVWFIVASVRTFSGEDEQNPYLQGIKYNQTLARRAEQKALNWHSMIAASRLAGGAVRISLNLRRSNNGPESGMALRGELRHPMDEGRDRALRFKETSRGIYQADLAGVSRGLWDVVVWSAAGQPPFEATRRLWVP